MQNPLTQVRETEFPMVTEYTYLNTASQGPWPHRTVAAVQAAAAAMQYVNTPRGMPEAAPAADLARQRLAQLLHAPPDHLVFTSNTTHGLNIAAQGITLRWKDRPLQCPWCQSQAVGRGSTYHHRPE